MNEMELAVHDFKSLRTKLNLSHLGNVTNIEKEFEDLCEFKNSGKINLSQLNSARDQNPEKNMDLKKTTPRSQVNEVKRGKS